MTLINENNVNKSVFTYQSTPLEEISYNPTAWETVKSAFKQENSIGSLIAYGLNDDGSTKYNPDFDPFEHIDGYDENALAFINANSIEDVERIKTRIDKERADRDILSESGALGIVSTIAAGILDPINLIPVGGQGYRAYKVGKLGKSILSSSARTALAGATGTLIQEVPLQLTQATRTSGDVAISVGSGTLLGGVLGAAAGSIGALRAKNIDKIAKKLDAADDDISYGPQYSTVGARQAIETTLEKETLVGALGLEKRLKFQDPVLRTANSPNLQTRLTSEALVDQNLLKMKNLEGIATNPSVESKIKIWGGNLYRSLNSLDELFVKYRLGKNKQFGDITRINIKDTLVKSDKLNRKNFLEEVGRAMRRGDTSDIPEVQEAARYLRKNIFDPIKKEAIRLELLPADVEVTTAESYLTRVYNREKIIQKRGDFEKIIVEWMVNGIDDVTTPIGEADLIAKEVTDKILGYANDGRIHYEGITIKRGPFKERTLNIPDYLLEDFLEDNIEDIAKMYLRTLAPDVELKFRFGSVDMKGRIQAINYEYDKLIDNVTKKRDAKKISENEYSKTIKRLDNERKSDVRDIEAMRDRLRGTYGIPDDPDGYFYRGARLFKGWNYVTKLGGMTISALTDVGGVIFSHGFTRCFRDGLAPLVKNLKTFKLAAEEVKLAGTALDLTLDTRGLALADIFYQYGKGSGLERFSQFLSDKLSVASLMAPWNASLKQFAGVITQARVLRECENWAKERISPKEKANLAKLGIDEQKAIEIYGQFKKYGEKRDGVYLARVDKWDSDDLITTYRASLNKEVDKIIVTPGQDKPLFMSKSLGSLLMQFKSFGIASTQRVLLAGLQRKDAEALQGMITMLGLGMLVHYLKTPPERRTDNIAEWVTNGFDRSGMMGWFFDVNNTLEKLSSGRFGLSRFTGEQAGRYQSRNVFGALAGPTAGTFEDFVRITAKIGSEDWTEADTRALRRLIPFQNLFYVRWLFDRMEERVNETIGIK